MARQKILLVDDDPPWLDLVELWLKGAGYEDLYKAHNGATALELARKVIPDCIILDLVLPDMDGIEVCKMIRSTPSLGKTPVILSTGHRKDKILGLEHGADYFVQKNENPAELLATIRAVFRRQELDRDIVRKGDVSVHLQTRRVYLRDLQVATLTPKTFELFYVLLERSPEPVHKDILFISVEGKPQPKLSRALDILMNRLRKVLPGELKDRIKAIKSFGYVYIPPQEEKPASPRK